MKQFLLLILAGIVSTYLAGIFLTWSPPGPPAPALTVKVGWISFFGNSQKINSTELQKTAADIEGALHLSGVLPFLSDILGRFGGGTVYELTLRNRDDHQLSDIEIKPSDATAAVVQITPDKYGINASNEILVKNDHGYIAIPSLDPDQMIRLITVTSRGPIGNDDIVVLQNGRRVTTELNTISEFDSLGFAQFVVSRAPISEFLILISIFINVLVAIGFTIAIIANYKFGLWAAIISKSDVQRMMRFLEYVKANKPDLF